MSADSSPSIQTEIIPKEALVYLNRNMLRIKLHMRTDFPSRVSLDIQTKENSSRINGRFMLHYIELSKISMRELDKTFNIHQPYVWSLVRGSQQHVIDDGTFSKPMPCKAKKIEKFDVSGDGRYLVTLSSTSPQKDQLIELWDLAAIMTECSGDQNKSDVWQQSGMPSVPQVPVAQTELLRWTNEDISCLNWSLSISFNGSQIAITAARMDVTKNYSDHHRAKIYSHHYSNQKGHDLLPSSNLGTTRMEYFYGLGQFYVKQAKDQHLKEETYYDLLRGLYGLKRMARDKLKTVKSQSAKDELFVAVDYGIIRIFGVFSTWEELWSIKDPSLTHPSAFALQDNRLVYMNSNALAVVWNIAARRFVSRFPIATTTTTRGSNDVVITSGQPRSSNESTITPTSIMFAKGGTLVVTADGTTVTSFFADSGSKLASYTAISIESVSAERKDDGLILVSNTEIAGENPNSSLTVSLLLDPLDMTIVRTLYTLPGLRLLLDNGGAFDEDGQYAFSVNKERLDCVKLLGRQTDTKCDDDCTKNSRNTVSTINTKPGLTFHVRGFVLEIISTSQDKPDENEPRLVELPIFSKEAPSLLQISPTFLHLIMVSGDLVLVWELPKTFEGDLVLQVVWYERDRNWTEPVFKECAHGHPFLRDHVSERLCKENAFTVEIATKFKGAIPHLLELFQAGEDEFYDDCLRYFGQHVNTYPAGEDSSTGILVQFCEAWTDESRHQYTRFLHAYFTSPHCRWVPLTKYTRRTNPLSILLRRAKKSPRIVSLFKIILEYCFDRVEKKNDLRFLSPITHCFRELFDPKHPHEELTSTVLRRFAYIPARHRQFVIDNHVVARSPDLRELIGRTKSLPLHEHRDPVLQLERRWSVEQDVHRESFTKGLYVATFGMLWHDKGSPSEPTESCRPAGQLPLFTYWIKVIPFVIVYAMNPFSKTIVKSHDFSLEDLDHPALYALIRYKWNRLGFMFWFVRFFYQCIYYILVLLAVFMQVYDYEHYALTWVFILITLFACSFLVLEAVQVLHNWRRYVDNIVYNLVDIIVFALPLGGSINQFQALKYPNDPEIYPRGPNNWFLSYSVVFIALHLLFELRVNKSVCQFVTIIVRIFGQIQIFFIIFMAGTLAFTTAILHLLRGCVRPPCMDPTTLFPKQYYQALATTYFFMSGKYDSISVEFTGDNYAFYTLMIIYLTFTVILMLNVLIAIINDAFSKGDTTWHLVWLQNQLGNIEAVENLSYYLPGLREHYDLFPREIYYAATPARKKGVENKLILREKEGALKVAQALQGYKRNHKKGKGASLTVAMEEDAQQQLSRHAYEPSSGSELSQQQPLYLLPPTERQSRVEFTQGLGQQPASPPQQRSSPPQSVQRLRERNSSLSLRNQTGNQGSLDGGPPSSSEIDLLVEEKVRAIVDERMRVTDENVLALRDQLDIITAILNRLER
ncbi:hypothetical protein BGZ83_010596 [Gryganskiella cystojenkinii]|nr:hypothetical protein BGZ83_010596 [Gryganskiella cystojenkinii]